MNKCKLTPKEKSVLRGIIMANNYSPNAHDATVEYVYKYVRNNVNGLKEVKKIMKKLNAKKFIYKHPTGGNVTYHFAKSSLECFDDLIY